MPEELKGQYNLTGHETSENGPINIYGRERFLPERAREHVEGLVASFKDYYSTIGYSEEPPVNICSGIDPTVRFIGSHISVFKPYLVEDRVPDPGIFMRQNCVRTRNANRLLDDSYSPNWGSYFASIGALARPERLNEACQETFDFFESELEISPENILIRINSSDTDLLAACREHYDDDHLEIDGQKPEYYRHNIGLEGINGRNFNIALRNPDTDGFSDVGNIILLESKQKKLGVEIALGTSTILKQLYGLEHVQDCSPVIGLESLDKSIRRKFEDSIITSTVLYREGLRPIGQNNRNRILKQYVRSLSYFRGKTGMNIETLTGIMSSFERREFPDSVDPNAALIAEFVQVFENELFAKKDLTEDEQKIKSVLEASKGM